jgi:hypothetical protein
LQTTTIYRKRRRRRRRRRAAFLQLLGVFGTVYCTFVGVLVLLFPSYIAYEIVAAGASFATILGCWSPATQKFSLFTTNTSPMISYLANATGFNETQFQHSDLPDAWAWGFSGTVSPIIHSIILES